jgi:hypothetical protein
LLEYLRDRLSVHLCTVVLRTESALAAGGFAEDFPFTGDIATWVPFLLKGKAGLVNESCGVYTLHAAAQTSQFNIDFRIQDIGKIVDLIDRKLDAGGIGQSDAGAIRRAARGYFSRHAFGIIASRRRMGWRLSELAPILWKWRGPICRGAPFVGAQNLPSLGKSAAMLLLPLPLLNGIRSWRRRRQGGQRT